MNRNTVALILIIFVLLLVGACGSDAPAPPQMLGWMVGNEPDSGYGVILHTEDVGRTWTRQGSAAQLPDAGFEDICVLDPETLLVVGDVLTDGTYNVYKTRDGGKTWARVVSSTLMNVGYHGIFFQGGHVWIVGEAGSVYRSDDQGDSWRRIEVPPEYQSDIFLRVAARNADDIWVVGDKHAADPYPIMLHTIDGGTNWVRLNPVGDLQINTGGSPHFLSIKVFGDSVWAVGGFGKFTIRSGDNGAHWSLLRTGGIYDANDIFVLSESEAYVVEDNNGVFHTSDAGVHWDDYSFTTGNYYLGVAVLQRKHVWVVGGPESGQAYSAIIYSPDGGRTWQRQTAQGIEDTTVALYKVRFTLAD
ncbi:MAG: WD40/YVTN/BNR-like repeat-containing protein [Syntrophales bacterium]